MSVRILVGDCREQLKTLEPESVHCVVTSPPYWGLRDYQCDGQIGLEATPEEHVAVMVDVFREVRRVLRKDGTCWVNYGDAYWSPAAKESREAEDASQAVIGTDGNFQRKLRRNTGIQHQRKRCGLKPKDLVGMPWRVAFALQADGWWLRSDIIWAKPNPMPESVTDRPTKAHEYVFLLAKAAKYFYDADAVREAGTVSGWSRQRAQGEDTWKYGRCAGGTGVNNTSRNGIGGTAGDGATRNLRTVWTIPTHPFPGAHFATFPPRLVEPCVKAGCPEGGTVLDPFGGAGTVGLVADRLQRDAVLCELNEEYAEMARKRIEGDCPMFAQVDMANGVEGE